MKQLLTLVVCLITAVSCWAQDDVDQLLAESNPTIQKQLQAISRVFRPGEGFSNNVDALREIKKLKELTDDKAELAKQVAIFSVAPEEEMQPLLALALLQYLELPSRVTIRTLAPYLDAKNPQLRSFVRDWFRGHDKSDSGEWGAVNYREYLDYVRWSMSRGEEIPAPFINYIYQRSPGRALLVFTHASGAPDTVARLKLMRKTLEARQQGKEPEPQDKTARQLEERGKVRLKAQREIVLAEHIVSDAIWLDKHGYIVRLQKALPEAKEALATLAEGEWWARLYVAYTMRQHPQLRRGDIWELLEKDSDELVRQATQPPQ